MFCQLTLQEYTESPLAYVPSLFALPAYLGQVSENIHVFSIQKEGKLEGVAPFFLHDKVAYNPPRATFGGWYGNALSTEVQASFWAWTMEKLRTQGAKTIYLKLPPDYKPLPALTGYTTQMVDLNYHLTLAEDFVGKLHESERRRLKKAGKAGFIASHWENPPLQIVYDFIAEARKRKGFPITLTFSAFEAMFALFGAYYNVFQVRSASDDLACLTVTVRIDDHVLYNFYPADAEAYLAYSPMVLLLEYVYSWAGRQGFEVFDLGIATAEGIRNEGLIRFKKNLGAIETEKKSLIFELS